MIDVNPRCALCGGSILELGSLLLWFEFMKGRPSIGWCEKCSMKDSIIQEIRGAANFEDVDFAISTINRRGIGRVRFERVTWAGSQKMRTSSPSVTASRSGCRERIPRTR